MEAKQELRQKMKRRRASLSRGQREQFSRLIAANLLQVCAAQEIQSIALFSSIGTEVDTSFAFEALSKQFAVAYPRVVQEQGILEFSYVESISCLVKGAYNIAEPPGDAIDLHSLDCIIIPGLAFGGGGSRLGYGGGYYDRTLKGFSGRRFGIAFQIQKLDEVPQHVHDQPVDGLFTEVGFYDFSER